MEHEKEARTHFLHPNGYSIYCIDWRQFGNSLGYDSQDILGASISRGQVGLVVLIPALLALPATLSLIKENSAKRKIPFFAHIVHLELYYLSLDT